MTVLSEKDGNKFYAISTEIKYLKEALEHRLDEDTIIAYRGRLEFLSEALDNIN